MPAGVQLFNGKRLAQARTARGLTAVTLSELAEVSTPSISLYEKGTQKPKQEIIERMAAALKVPVIFFYKDIDVAKPEKLFYRSMSAATKATRTRAESKYEWALEVMEYLMEFFDYPAFNFPDLDVPEDFLDLENDLVIESLAQQLRDYWNLGTGPIVDLVRTLESNGVLVWRTELEAKTLDAFSEFREPHPVVVLSSDKENYFRSRFDAAHELGHLLLHRHIDRTTLNKSSEFKKIEEQAHRFAGAFLLPATSYSNDLWAPTLDAFRTLKPQWNVSIAMQIMRSKQLHLIDEDQQKRLWINMSRRKWRQKEPLDDSTPAEKPGLINKSIKMLVDEKVRTRDQIVSDLSLSALDIEKLCELPEGYMRNIQDEELPRLKGKNAKILPFKR